MAAIPGNLFVRQRSRFRLRNAGCASRDARNNGDGFTPFQRRRILVQVADVLIVHIDVDKAAKLALVIEQILLDIGVLRRKLIQRIRHSSSVHFDGVLLLGELPQSRRDQDFCHFNSSLSAWVWSASGRKLFACANLPFWMDNTTNEYHGHEFCKSVCEKYASQSGCE